VIEVAERGLNDDVTHLVNALVGEGLVHFEYIRDPGMHPKDVLDYWRIQLTGRGREALACSSR